MDEELYTSYKRSFNGKHAAADAIDTLFFAFAFALLAYILVRRRISGTLPKIVIAALAAVFVIVMSGTIRRIRFERHIERLRCDTAMRIFREKLLLMKPSEFGAAVMRARSFAGSELVILQRSRLITNDDIYEAVRRSQTERVVLVSVSDADDEAKKLLEKDAFHRVKFILAERITALREAFSPAEKEISQAIIESFEKRRKSPHNIRALLKPDRAKKYFILGAGLIAASFISRYSLYLRLIAAASITAAGLISAKRGFDQRPEKV